MGDNLLGKEKYIHTSVCIPIVKCGSDKFVLLEKRTSDIKHAGELSFPGGMIEDGEDAETAAKRELMEELSFNSADVKAFSKLGFMISPIGYLIHVFVCFMDVTTWEKVCFNEAEVEELVVVPFEEFLNLKPEFYNVRLKIFPYDEIDGEKRWLLPVNDLDLPERYLKPWGSKKYRVVVYRWKGNVIWGITGEVVYEFVNALKKDNIKLDF
ncbi:NUDIX hydrolase [Desulfurobacterium sp.]